MKRMMLHSSDPRARYKTRSDEIQDLSSGAGPRFAKHTQSNAKVESPVAFIPPFRFFSVKSSMVMFIDNQYFMQI